MSTVLSRLVYCSRNAMSGSRESTRHEIDRILFSARRNNPRLGITGALLFNRGCFAQVLEGPREAIETLFETISCDIRHDTVTVLEIAPISVRHFPDWSMAYAGMLEDGRATFGALTIAPNGAATILSMLQEIVVREERV